MAEPDLQISNDQQRRTLLIVLVLNFLLFASLAVTGWFADSSALIANAVDNLSDTAVYAISWVAVGRSPKLKATAAKFSGVMLIAFAGLVVLDAARRPFFGPEPIGPTMIVMATIAAAVNLFCFFLLKSMMQKDVNTRAAMTFSANDFASNGGIVLAGGLVWWTGSFIPDVVVGLAVGLIALFGGLRILADAKRESGASAQSEQGSSDL